MSKDEILKKIQEVAATLGGKSPSLGDMEKYAGINANTWKGIHWLRWADALAEAGYVPNQFSNEQYGTERCTIDILNFIRMLNRIPQWLELKMYKQKSPNFPTTTALRRNFGGKTWDEIKVDLKKHCEKESAYADLLPLFKDIDSNLFQKKYLLEIKEATFGYVYLIQHGDRKEYKIGKTNNLIRRQGEIKLELPEQTKPIHTIETDDPSGVERYWHNRFQSKRKNGEWFELDNIDVRAFQRWKKIF